MDSQVSFAVMNDGAFNFDYLFPWYFILAQFQLDYFWFGWKGEVYMSACEVLDDYLQKEFIVLLPPFPPVLVEAKLVQLWTTGH